MKGEIGGEEVRQKNEKRQNDKEKTEWHKGKKRGRQNEKRQNDIKTK